MDYITSMRRAASDVSDEGCRIPDYIGYACDPDGEDFEESGEEKDDESCSALNHLWKRST